MTIYTETELRSIKTFNALKGLIKEINSTLSKKDRLVASHYKKASDKNKLIQDILSVQEQFQTSTPIEISEQSLTNASIQQLGEIAKERGIEIEKSKEELIYLILNDNVNLTEFYFEKFLTLLNTLPPSIQQKYSQVLSQQHSPSPSPQVLADETDIVREEIDLNDTLQRNMNYLNILNMKNVSKSEMDKIINSKSKTDEKVELTVEIAERNIRKCLGLM